MTRKSHPQSIEFLRTIILYNSETGRFVWLPREASMFKTERAYKAWVTRFENQEAGFAITKAGYYRTTILGVSHYAHRLAWALHYGEWPDADIDHINGDPKDNRISNLRSVSHLENCRNISKPINNTSGVIGVSWSQDREKWTAYIDDGKGRIPLGRYVQFHEAVIARKAAELALRYHENHGR
jgi:hypothetical protein